MSSDDLENILASYAQKYPALVSVEQASEIAQRPTKTIYHWSSLGQLAECKSRRGKRLLISRDCLVLFLLSEDVEPQKKSA
jgi:hypothetical protein